MYRVTDIRYNNWMFSKILMVSENSIRRRWNVPRVRFSVLFAFLCLKLVEEISRWSVFINETVYLIWCTVIVHKKTNSIRIVMWRFDHILLISVVQLIIIGDSQYWKIEYEEMLQNVPQFYQIRLENSNFFSMLVVIILNKCYIL